MSGEPSDQELVVALQRRDVSALERLYDRYGAVAYSLTSYILHDERAAEDVVQDVFFNIWRQAASFDSGRGSVRAWLLSACRHRAIDYLRHRRARASCDVDLNAAELELPGPDLWDQVVNRLDRSLLLKAMAGLPDGQREALEMAYFKGLSHAEIAQATGAPLGTVKGRLRLALEKMREVLSANGLGRGE